jgi:hypothetical protein
MKNVTYTELLKNQLDLIRKTTAELSKEDPAKSVEQFLAEIIFVKTLLEETEEFIH